LWTSTNTKYNTQRFCLFGIFSRYEEQNVTIMNEVRNKGD